MSIPKFVVKFHFYGDFPPQVFHMRDVCVNYHLLANPIWGAWQRLLAAMAFLRWDRHWQSKCKHYTVSPHVRNTINYYVIFCGGRIPYQSRFWFIYTQNRCCCCCWLVWSVIPNVMIAWNMGAFLCTVNMRVRRRRRKGSVQICNGKSRFILLDWGEWAASMNIVREHWWKNAYSGGIARS